MGERGDSRNQWLERARCRGLGDQMYSTYTSIGLGYCARCPVLVECRVTVMNQEKGLPLDERYGVAAKMTPKERWMLDGCPVRIEPQEG